MYKSLVRFWRFRACSVYYQLRLQSINFDKRRRARLHAAGFPNGPQVATWAGIASVVNVVVVVRAFITIKGYDFVCRPGSSNEKG